MFCHQCGTNQSDELKFCKSCGSNLYAVRKVVATREAGEKFDWTRTWVAEMFLSPGETRKSKEESIELQRGITPEVSVEGNQGWRNHGKRSASRSVSFSMYSLQGIILGGKSSWMQAEIISRLWIVGVIPLFVGIGLLINGLLVKSAGKYRQARTSWRKRPRIFPCSPATQLTPFLPA